MNIVYKTTNLINGKQYIGSHYTKNIEDGYLGSGFALKLALKKYTRNNFKREILEYCENLIDARKLEEYYIQKLNTLSPNGYNISPTGGMGIFGVHSAESKNKMSISHKKFWDNLNENEKNEIRIRFKDNTYDEIYGLEKSNQLKILRKKNFEKNSPTVGKFGIDNPNFGSKRTEETKRKISESLKDKPKSDIHKKSLSKAWEKRKIEHPVSEETKKKMSETSKGKINIKTYKVIDPNGVKYITTNGLTKFCEEHNLTVTLLHKVVMSERKHHKKWKCELIH